MTAQPAAAALDAGQREILAQALTDALHWRTPEGWCPDCDARPEGPLR